MRVEAFAECTLAEEAEAVIVALVTRVHELEAEATRNLIHGTVKGFTAGENADAKHWRQRAEAAEGLEAELFQARGDCEWLQAERNALERKLEAAEAARSALEAKLQELEQELARVDGSND